MNAAIRGHCLLWNTDKPAPGWLPATQAAFNADKLFPLDLVTEKGNEMANPVTLFVFGKPDSPLEDGRSIFDPEGFNPPTDFHPPGLPTPEEVDKQKPNSPNVGKK